MEINYQPQRSGYEVRMDYDPATGEYLEPQVGYGHNPHSVFADDEQYTEDVQLPPEATESHDVDDDIADAIHELYPIDAILDYVVNTYPEEFYADYDKAVDAGDWGKVHEFLDRMNAEYMEANPQPEEFNREAVEQELDQLAGTEPEGTELAFELLQQAEQTSDPLASEILQMSAAFHRGEVDAQTAIQSMLDKHDINQLIQTYNNLYS